MTARELPVVDPLMVRAFTPTGKFDYFGGVLVLDTFDVRDVGPVTERLDYDEPAVDCSQRMFQITTWLLMDDEAPTAIACFPSRRWRNLRAGERIIGHPSRETPLLYIGNPVRVFKDAQGLGVYGRGEFVIKSGPELGF